MELCLLYERYHTLRAAAEGNVKDSEERHVEAALKLNQAIRLAVQQDIEGAIEAANEAISLAQTNVDGYSVRAALYAVFVSTHWR